MEEIECNHMKWSWSLPNQPVHYLILYLQMILFSFIILKLKLSVVNFKTPSNLSWNAQMILLWLHEREHHKLQT